MVSKRRPVGWSVAALSLGTALNPLNSSMIAVALVVLRDEFNLSVATVTWVITSFYLASAALQPLMGRLADRFGPRRMFIFGMSVVALTCVLAPFSPSFFLVCVARVFMAVGTATAFPSAVAMVTTLAKQAHISSTRSLGNIQMANTAGAAVGPVVGGVLVSLIGWPALFAINVPLSLISLVAVLKLAPSDAPRERQNPAAALIESDIPGILYFTAALVAFLTCILNAVPGYRWWLLAAGAVLAALFSRRELRFRAPFLDVRMIGRNRPLLLIYIGFAIFNAVYYCAFYGLPQLLQESAGYSPDTVGLLMLPLAAVSVVGTPIAARSIDRWGVRRVLAVGGYGLVAASGLLWLLTASAAIVMVLVLTALMGVPYCIISIASSQGMYASARPHERGVAAGVLQTFRYLGAITATAVIGAVFRHGVTMSNWGSIIPVMLGLSVAALIVALLWKPSGRVHVGGRDPA